jgi:hypothetical protein
LRGNLRLVERLRLDQVANRLGLREIDPTIQECPHSELARLGHARPALQRQFDNVPQHDRRSMAGDLNDFIGGIRMRLRKIRRNNLVDAISGSRLDKFAEVRSSRLELLAAG